ncbi:Ig-like domain-containing protein [Christensenellaceae bacterium OttesenSCG-928-L17]|nr:Ig-like domain-containing protein [Christensenellaceae bacterium OttesenSCG-928-L17]
MKKHILSLLLVVSVLLCAIAPPALAATVEKTEPALTLVQTECELFVGEKFQLEVQTPPELAKAKLTYSTNSSRVATISSKGVLRAQAPGIATISVKAGKQTATCAVRVYAKAKSIALAEASYTIKPGKTVQLNPTIDPKDAKLSFAYATSNKKVATVSESGLVKGGKEGEATITITGPNDTSTTCTVVVSKKDPPALKEANASVRGELIPGKDANTFSLYMEVGDAHFMHGRDASGGFQKINYTSATSSNKKVATVDKYGRITAVGVGKATVTMQPASGAKKTCFVEVAKQTVYSFVDNTEIESMTKHIQFDREYFCRKPKFERSAALEKIAQTRALEIADDYKGAAGNTARVKELLKKAGVKYTVVQEFTAKSREDAYMVFSDWKKQASGTMNTVLKSDDYKHMAVAFVDKDNDRYNYWVVLFIG